jgi:maltose-binding protein MalE
MILWNKSTIQEAVKDYEKKYNVKVKIMNEKFKK